MDIQKEREAFEAWAKISIENFVDLEHYGKFYVVQENSRLTIRKREFLLLAANRGWKAWKERAKLQTVPEGFVLVNADQLNQWGHMANYAEQYGCPECFEARGYAHTLTCEINEYFAIEAQEQK